MTAYKWNNLTPEQMDKANELLRQAKFEEFEEYLNDCQPKNKENNDELLQSEEYFAER